MQLDPNRPPSFRTHLLKEGFMDKILIPSKFMRKHKKMLAKSCILQSDVAGISWKARIKKEKPNYFICDGEWAQFVVYHKPEIGDFLLFFLIDKFTFHVILYSKKRSGNLTGELPFEELSSSSEEEGAGKEEEVEKEDEKEEENIEASRELKKFKMEQGESSSKLKWISQEPIDISDSEEESVDPTRRSKDGGNPCCSRPGKSDVKADNMVGMKKRVDPPSGSKDGGNPCCSRPGCKCVLCLKKKAPETKEVKKAAKHPDRPKRPAGAFSTFMKQFNKENPKNKSVVAVGSSLELDEEEVEKEDENIEASKKSKKVKMEPRESSAHATRTNESDDDSLEGTPQRSNRGKEKLLDMVEHYSENLGHCPSGQSSKTKRQEGDAENDVSVDMHTKRIEIEKLLEDLGSPYFPREDQTSGGGCKMHNQQSNVFYDRRKDIMDTEKSIAYKRATANSKWKIPFFISFMHPSYINKSSFLCINLAFAKKYIPENCSNIVLRVPGRGSWPVKYSVGKRQAKFQTGWTKFSRDNQLKVGDVCVFEVIEGTPLSIDITIFRAVEN